MLQLAVGKLLCIWHSLYVHLALVLLFSHIAFTSRAVQILSTEQNVNQMQHTCQ